MIVIFFITKKIFQNEQFFIVNELDCSQGKNDPFGKKNDRKKEQKTNDFKSLTFFRILFQLDFERTI